MKIKFISLAVLFTMIFSIGLATVVNAMPVINEGTGENHLTVQARIAKSKTSYDLEKHDGHYIYLTQADSIDLQNKIEDRSDNCSWLGWLGSGASGVFLGLKRCAQTAFIVEGLGKMANEVKKQLSRVTDRDGVLIKVKYTSGPQYVLTDRGALPVPGTKANYITNVYFLTRDDIVR